MPINTGLDLLDGQLYYPGQIVTTVGAEQAVIRTGFNKQNAVIPFGYGVAKGTNDDELILPSDNTAVFRGIATVMNIEKRLGYSMDSGSRFGAPINHEMAYMEEGDVAVYVDGDVTQGGAVYWNVAASSSVIGAFRGTSNSTNTVQITGAYWLRTVTGGTNSALKVAPLRINRP